MERTTSEYLEYSSVSSSDTSVRANPFRIEKSPPPSAKDLDPANYQYYDASFFDSTGVCKVCQQVWPEFKRPKNKTLHCLNINHGRALFVLKHFEDHKWIRSEQQAAMNRLFVSKRLRHLNDPMAERRLLMIDAERDYMYYVSQEPLERQNQAHHEFYKLFTKYERNQGIVLLHLVAWKICCLKDYHPSDTSYYGLVDWFRDGWKVYKTKTRHSSDIAILLQCIVPWLK